MSEAESPWRSKPWRRKPHLKLVQREPQEEDYAEDDEGCFWCAIAFFVVAGLLAWGLYSFLGGMKQ